MKTLLLGMGNPILSDDAVGVRLATDLKGRLAGVAGLEVVEDCSVGGLAVLEVLEGFDRVIVLDAVRTTGGTPGSWYRFDGRALQHTLHLTNVHDANFATALELGLRLGMHLPQPADVDILAVEVEDTLTFSERLSPALEEAYPQLCAAVFREVESLLGDQR